MCASSRVLQNDPGLSGRLREGHSGNGLRGDYEGAERRRAHQHHLPRAFPLSHRQGSCSRTLTTTPYSTEYMSIQYCTILIYSTVPVTNVQCIKVPFLEKSVQ